jgi:hypothetical protein
MRFDGLRFRKNQLEIRVFNAEWRWRPWTRDGYSGQAQTYFTECLMGEHGPENEQVAAA